MTWCNSIFLDAITLWVFWCSAVWYDVMWCNLILLDLIHFNWSLFPDFIPSNLAQFTRYCTLLILADTSTDYLYFQFPLFLFSLLGWSRPCSWCDCRSRTFVTLGVRMYTQPVQHVLFTRIPMSTTRIGDHHFHAALVCCVCNLIFIPPFLFLFSSSSSFLSFLSSHLHHFCTQSSLPTLLSIFCSPFCTDCFYLFFIFTGRD